MQDNKNNLQGKSKQIDKPVLSERDFYPPKDDRHWESGVQDIKGGDNFTDYAEDLFRRYEDEGW